MTRLDVGRIAKAHGLRGEVVVDLVTDRLERLAPGSELLTAAGPLVVHASRPHQHRFIVAFEGVESREEAEALAGRVLTAEAIDDPDALWVHDLVGSSVQEVSGVVRGRVVAVLDNPAHALLELDSGALVPLPFVVTSAGGVVVIDPPAGLFDV